MGVATSDGREPDEPNCSTSIATCKPRGYPSVKPQRRFTSLTQRFKCGERGRIVSMHALVWLNFLKVVPVSPSSTDWSWLYMWCVSRLARVGFAWSVSWPRSWRRPPQLPMCEAKAPTYRKHRVFEGSDGHPEWPKVADTVIEAALHQFCGHPLRTRLILGRIESALDCPS